MALLRKTTVTTFWATIRQIWATLISISGHTVDLIVFFFSVRTRKISLSANPILPPNSLVVVGWNPVPHK